MGARCLQMQLFNRDREHPVTRFGSARVSGAVSGSARGQGCRDSRRASRLTAELHDLA